MKSTIVTFFLFVMLSFQAFASDEQVHCIKAGYNLAYVIMQLRQADYPLPEMLNKAETKLEQLIINEAYTYPVMNLDKNKEKVQKEFAEKMYMSCMRVLSQSQE